MIRLVPKAIARRIVYALTSSFSSSENEFFFESREFWRPPTTDHIAKGKSPQGVEEQLLSYILEHCPKNQPGKTLEFIDKYCKQSWMMNAGPEKRRILEKVVSENKIKKVLDIGTYCGYSAIALSLGLVQPESKVYTLQINGRVAEIAKKIIAHSGVRNINVLTENIHEAGPFLNEVGPFDLVFMDQQEDEYLPDLHYLEQRNLIRAGAIIIADNIIYPGAATYLAFMQESALKKKFKSVLYHSYDAYTDVPDAVMVSHKIY